MAKSSSRRKGRQQKVTSVNADDDVVVTRNNDVSHDRPRTATKETSIENKRKAQVEKNKLTGTSSLLPPQQQRIVTMEALQELSSDDDSSALLPESEWNDEARALKTAIEAGTFDAAVINNHSADGESSFEEVDLDDDDHDDDDEDDDVPEEKAEPTEQHLLDDKDDGGEDDDEIDAEDDESDADDMEEISDNHVNDVGEGDVDGDEENDDDEEEEEEEDEVFQSIADNNATKAKALRVVAGAIAAEKKDWPWVETFDIIPPTPLPFDVDPKSAGRTGADITAASPLGIHDDLQREVAFYDLALEAVIEAKLQCQKAGVPFTRPDDFFAEMVKTDGTCTLILVY
jgi:rRNA-processing protein EBP2